MDTLIKSDTHPRPWLAFTPDTSIEDAVVIACKRFGVPRDELEIQQTRAVLLLRPRALGLDTQGGDRAR